MRNSSFFQKLTGSLRLSDEDISTLSESDKKAEKEKPAIATPSKKVVPKEVEVEEIIEEVDDDDFEIPEDAEIETIEEVIEDDSIDHEEVEEYYEEIIDEEEPEEVSIEEAEEDTEEDDSDEEEYEDEEDEDDVENDDHSIYGDSHHGEYDEDVEISSTHGKDYPVFKMKNNQSIDNEDLVDEEVQEENELQVNHHEEEHEASPHELPVDVFEMHNEVVIRVLVPGITPENLKVSITRNHVSLACSRPAPDGIKDTSYFEREIPYGVFNRMIQLPSDVDVEHAEAVEKYGLLIIRLPKIDVKKVQELKIKSV